MKISVDMTIAAVRTMTIAVGRQAKDIGLKREGVRRLFNTGIINKTLSANWGGNYDFELANAVEEGLNIVFSSVEQPTQEREPEPTFPVEDDSLDLG
jgi:hypothetical protein